MKEILVIDDDPNILLLFQGHFKHELDVRFIYASSYVEAVNLISHRKFDMYVVDINLNGQSGLHLLKMLPIETKIENRIITISSNGSVENQINSYELGAANFLAKPIPLELLRVILKKNIRNINSYQAASLDLPNLKLEAHSHTCYLKNESGEKNIKLTPIEFNILYRLAKSPNIIVNKEELSYLGKDINEPMSYKSLEMHIASIRKKIGEQSIVTHRSIGYHFVK